MNEPTGAWNFLVGEVPIALGYLGGIPQYKCPKCDQTCQVRTYPYLKPPARFVDCVADRLTWEVA